MDGRHFRRLAAVAASLLLSACAGGEMGNDTKAIDADFACGTEIAHTRFEKERLTLTLGPKIYALTQARSGSGARYTGASSDGPVEFWNKGRNARLTIGKRTLPECHQQGDTR